MLVYSNGKIISVKADYAQLSYRSSAFQINKDVVLAATFKLKRQPIEILIKNQQQVNAKRKSSQPMLPSAGSVFKKVSGISAGQLIDQAGLKGATVGRAQISTIHAGFIVNLGGATSQDVKNLVILAQNTVEQKYNITLQREIEYIGEIDEINSRLSYP